MTIKLKSIVLFFNPKKSGNKNVNNMNKELKINPKAHILDINLTILNLICIKKGKVTLLINMVIIS